MIEQPVKFSHAIHCGENAIACTFCHYSAGQSQNAGMPPVKICYNCHSLISVGSRSGEFEIKKITASYTENRPIEWIRINHLPDFVFFSHEQHLSTHRLTCETCHGTVATMERIIPQSKMSMAWCLQCHQTSKIYTGDTIHNKRTEVYKKTCNTDSITLLERGGNECGKCHY
jgi:hypothetical protein